MPNNSIDERVVEMRIENKQFVKGAEKTITVLDRLKSALNFGKTDDPFDSMANNVESLSERFSALGIMGKRALENVTDSAYRFITGMYRSLSSDQIAAGWEKYNRMAEATQRIISSTHKYVGTVYADEAEQMEAVNKVLEQLNWFTDETSYNLTDMTDNIGKFTSVGVDLETAATAMQGIATWAGLAGANTQEASRAMYNLSQAMGAGAMLTIDWRSIENAGMATEEFKQTVLDIASNAEMFENGAARLTKTVDRAGNVVYKTLKGTVVTTQNFTQTLNERWFDDQVITGALHQYGKFSNALKDVIDYWDAYGTGYDLTATDILQASKKIMDGEKTVAQWHQEMVREMGDESVVPSMETLEYIMSVMSDEQLELGRRAFMAAQECKTLEDAINAVKDAVSTGWMKTFQYIFGDLNEAKELWSDLNGKLTDIFTSGMDRRNAILKYWHDHGGRDALLEGFNHLYEAVQMYIQPITDAFHEIFPRKTIEQAGYRLGVLSMKFRHWAESVKPSEETIEGIKNAFKKLFEAIKNVGDKLRPVGQLFKKTLGYVASFFGLLFRSFSGDGFDKAGFLSGVKDIFKGLKGYVDSAWESIRNWLDSMYDIPVIGPLLGIVSKALGGIRSAFGFLIEKVKSFNIQSEDLAKPIQFIDGLLRKIKESLDNIDLSRVSGWFETIKEAVKQIFGGLFGNESKLREQVSSAATNIFSGIGEALNNITIEDVFDAAKTGTLGYIIYSLISFILRAKKVVKDASSIPEKFGGILDSISGSIKEFGKSFSKDLKANAYLKLAGAIGILAVSMWLLSKVPSEKMMEVAVTLGFLMLVLSSIVKRLENVDLFKQGSKNVNKLTVNVLPKLAANLIAMAIAIAACIAALKIISKMAGPELGTGLFGLFAIIAMLVAAIKLMDDVKIDWKSALLIASFAGTIIATAVSLRIIGTMSWDKIWQSSLALIAIIGMLAVGVKGLDDVKINPSAFAGLFSLIAAIYLLIPALLIFGLVAKAGVLWASIGAIAALAAILVGFTAIGGLIAEKVTGLGKFAKIMLAVSASILLLSIALAIATPAIITLTGAMIGLFELLKTVNWSDILDSFAKAIPLIIIFGGLAVVLIAFAAAAALVGAAVLLAGVGMLAFGVGLSAAAAAISVLALVLVPFGAALTEFCNMLVENGDAILLIIGAVITGIITILVIKKFEIAMATVAVIIAIITVIAEKGPEIIQVLYTVAEQVLIFLVSLIPLLIKFLVLGVIEIINGTANSLRANRGALLNALNNLISVILETLLELIGMIAGDFIGLLIGAFFGKDAAKEWKNGIQGAFAGWATDVSEVLVDPSAMEASGIEQMSAYADGLSSTESQTRLQGSMTDMLGAFGPEYEIAKDDASTAGAGITESLGSSFTSPEALANLTGGMDTSLASLIPSYNTAADTAGVAGENVTTSFANAAMANWPVIQQAGITNATTYRDAFNGTLGIHSPSREAIKSAGFFAEGFVRGIRDNLDKVSSSSKGLADSALTALQKAMLDVSTLADEDLTLSPTITPVVDMSNVTDSANAIGGMFSNNSQVSIGQRIGRNISDVESLARNMQDISEAKSTVTTTEYNLNIYPEAGMDEEQFADYVILKLQNGIMRKGVSLG